MEWISVKDRLPDEHVLFNFEEPFFGTVTLEQNVGYYDEESDSWYFAINDHKVKTKVTHWMPLPESPKE